MIWLVFIGLSVLFTWLYFRFFKIPKLKNIVFVDGSLGTGKSFYCVYLAIKVYKRNHRLWWIAKNILRRDVEEPILISNIPLQDIEYQPLTLDVIERKKRIPYRSVVFIDEISLLADQMDYKNKYVNDCLRDFAKLFRHFSHNGTLIFNSQSISDVHFGFRYCLSDYIYIHHKTKFPFVSALKVQEMAYSADPSGNVVNAVHGDVEDSLKTILVPNRYFKKYDSLCFSILTDSLKYDKHTILLEKGDSLKTKDIVTFRQGRYELRMSVDEIKERAN